MKKYTRPNIEVVELSVRESLSALPGNFGAKGFKFNTMRTLSGAKNVTMYLKDSGNVTS